MTSTLTAIPAPATALDGSRTISLRQALAPDAGMVRMPCFESVPDTQDAVTAHQAECVECQHEVYA